MSRINFLKNKIHNALARICCSGCRSSWKLTHLAEVTAAINWWSRSTTRDRAFRGHTILRNLHQNYFQRSHHLVVLSFRVEKVQAQSTHFYLVKTLQSPPSQVFKVSHHLGTFSFEVCQSSQVFSLLVLQGTQDCICLSLLVVLQQFFFEISTTLLLIKIKFE